MTPGMASIGQQAKYIAPAIHAFLFIAMWASYTISGQGLSEGLSGVLLAILMTVDLPFSIIAFAVMFGGGREGDIAVVAWGLGGTFWWYLLGLALGALIRRRSLPKTKPSHSPE
jgi:hypothetical protein